MAKKNNRKLSNILINHKFQIKYLSWHFFLAAFISITYAAIFYFYTKENYDLLINLSDLTDEAKNQLNQELFHIILILGLISLLFLASIVLLSLFFSHRIAGPIHQVKVACDKIAHGHKNVRLKFRTRDDFKDLETSFNKMLDEIKN